MMGAFDDFVDQLESRRQREPQLADPEVMRDAIMFLCHRIDQLERRLAMPVRDGHPIWREDD